MSEDFSSRRILVADDNSIINKLVESIIIKSINTKVACVEDGDTALERLMNENFDVFVTDMVMPGCNSLDLIVRAKGECPDLDIIVMTGFPEKFPYVDVVNAGAADFITKPFSRAEMEAKLRRILRERELREGRIIAEEKYRSLFQFSVDGMLLLEPDNYGIIDSNAAMCKMLHKKYEELNGGCLMDHLAEGDKIRLEQGIVLCSASGQGTIGDIGFKSGDNSQISADISITFVKAAGEKFAFLVVKDVTEKREIERKLEEFAQTDDLTGLYNRRVFSTRMEWAIDRARRDKDLALTLAFIDIDNFKACNDTYGHQAGDQVLTGIGKSIRSRIRCRVGDEGFRYGGDEFAALLIAAHTNAGLRVGKALQQDLEETDNYGTTLSIGVAEFEKGMDSNALVKAADKALYKAKSEGKNTICVA